MDKLQADMQKMMKETEMLIALRLPVAAGKFAKQRFQSRFLNLNGGFVNGGIHPWSPAKRFSSWGRVKDAQLKAIHNKKMYVIW